MLLARRIHHIFWSRRNNGRIYNRGNEWRVCAREPGSRTRLCSCVASWRSRGQRRISTNSFINSLMADGRWMLRIPRDLPNMLSTGGEQRVKWYCYCSLQFDYGGYDCFSGCVRDYGGSNGDGSVLVMVTILMLMIQIIMVIMIKMAAMMLIITMMMMIYEATYLYLISNARTCKPPASGSVWNNVSTKCVIANNVIMLNHLMCWQGRATHRRTIVWLLFPRPLAIWRLLLWMVLCYIVLLNQHQCRRNRPQYVWRPSPWIKLRHTH